MFLSDSDGPPFYSIDSVFISTFSAELECGEMGARCAGEFGDVRHS